MEAFGILPYVEQGGPLRACVVLFGLHRARCAYLLAKQWSAGGYRLAPPLPGRMHPMKHPKLGKLKRGPSVAALFQHLDLIQVN